MKKLLFVFTALLLFSCSSDDNSSSNSAFNPPAWIQGTWGVKTDGTTPETPLYKFTSNNLCQLSQATSLCWKESIAQAPSIYSGSDVSTDSSYEANLIQSQGAVTFTLKFKKVSTTKIIWVYNGINSELDKLD
jgi:hypothetical protein